MARINISIPEEIIKKVDTYKEMVKISRSGFILNALENYFTQVERKLLEDKKKDAYQSILSLREMVSPLFKGWDSTSEIRKLRDTRWAGDKK
jgi:metal-responsive CopG/Arc/MetJ family transcriptional regulator